MIGEANLADKLHPSADVPRKALRLYDEVGARVTGARHLDFNIAGRCENPVGIEDTFRPVVLDVEKGVRPAKLVAVSDGKPWFIDGTVMCRRCAWCLRRRARLWAHRATAEVRHAPRTWFGTLTLKPERQFYILTAARAAYKKSALGVGESVDLDAQDSETKFRYLLKVLGPETALFLKRVRERADARVRYMLVFERHMSGDPHVHLLVHERDFFNGVKKSVLQQSWHWGFSNFKLADQSSAYYVCKYLAKEMNARVRASFRYGKIGLDPSQIENLSVLQRTTTPNSFRVPERVTGS